MKHTLKHKILMCAVMLAMLCAVFALPSSADVTDDVIVIDENTPTSSSWYGETVRYTVDHDDKTAALTLDGADIRIVNGSIEEQLYCISVELTGYYELTVTVLDDSSIYGRGFIGGDGSEYAVGGICLSVGAVYFTGDGLLTVNTDGNSVFADLYDHDKDSVRQSETFCRLEGFSLNARADSAADTDIFALGVMGKVFVEDGCDLTLWSDGTALYCETLADNYFSDSRITVEYAGNYGAFTFGSFMLNNAVFTVENAKVGGICIDGTYNHIGSVFNTIGSHYTVNESDGDALSLTECMMFLRESDMTLGNIDGCGISADGSSIGIIDSTVKAENVGVSLIESSPRIDEDGGSAYIGGGVIALSRSKLSVDSCGGSMLSTYLAVECRPDDMFERVFVHDGSGIIQIADSTLNARKIGGDALRSTVELYVEENAKARRYTLPKLEFNGKGSFKLSIAASDIAFDEVDGRGIYVEGSFTASDSDIVFTAKKNMYVGGEVTDPSLSPNITLDESTNIITDPSEIKSFEELSLRLKIVRSILAATRYDMTAEASEGGSVTVSDEKPYYGDKVTFTAEADDGWRVADFKVNGVSQGSIGEYTLTARTGVKVEVTFEKIEN